MHRAKLLARRYQDWVFFVVRGDGVYEVRCAPEPAAAAAAGSSASGSQQQQQQQQAGTGTAAAAAAAAQRAPAARVTVRCIAAFSSVLRKRLGLSGAAAAAGQPAAVAAAALAAAGARGRASADHDEDTVIQPPHIVGETLQAALRQYDTQLHTVKCVIGYSMIRRSLSVRTDHCVPTHIICAPSAFVSLADYVQMVGRSMGNNRGVLERFGLDCVRVLTTRQDFEALRQYYGCEEYLHRGPGPMYCGIADGTAEGLDRTLVNVPERFKAVLLHNRRQGQIRMHSREVMQQRVEWDEVIEIDKEETEDSEMIGEGQERELQQGRQEQQLQQQQRQQHECRVVTVKAEPDTYTQGIVHGGHAAVTAVKPKPLQ